MSDSSHFIKIDYINDIIASTNFANIENLNNLDLAKKYGFLKDIISKKLVSGNIKTFPDIDFNSISVELRSSSIIFYLYGFCEDFDNLTLNVANAFYSSEVNSIYMLSHDLDLELSFVSDFKESEFKSIYMQGNSSAYENDYDNLFWEIDSREELLNKFKELNSQGKLSKKSFSKDSYIESCADLTIPPESYIFSAENVDFIGQDGETPLTAAIKANNTDSVRMLLEFMDADVGLKNGKDELPVELSKVSQSTEIKNYFT